MPAAASEILVAVKVAVGQDVEAGSLFIADDDRERILELLAKANIHHAGVERLRPHADVEPARARPRARDGRWQHEIFRNGEGHWSSCVMSGNAEQKGLAPLHLVGAAYHLALPKHAASGRRRPL